MSCTRWQFVANFVWRMFVFHPLTQTKYVYDKLSVFNSILTIGEGGGGRGKKKNKKNRQVLGPAMKIMRQLSRFQHHMELEEGDDVMTIFSIARGPVSILAILSLITRTKNVNMRSKLKQLQTIKSRHLMIRAYRYYFHFLSSTPHGHFITSMELTLKDWAMTQILEQHVPFSH